MSPTPDVPTFDGVTAVRVNAWTGDEPAVAPFGGRRTTWAMRTPVLSREQSLAPSPPDPADWRSPQVGWGLVLPDRPGLTPEEKARAVDAPEPLRALLADRPASKVLRYLPSADLRSWVLRDYAGGNDLMMATAPQGVGPNAIPGYLLIAASPAEIPWSVQYMLNPIRRVGRLDLDAEGLENYVRALISGWGDSKARYSHPVVWSVSHGGGDITQLMRDAVGAPLHACFAADSDMPSAVFVDGAAATVPALCSALAAASPAVVVTTSHGQTGPVADLVLMGERLGALVGADRVALDPASLLSTWQPDGAVWFAQACCSAGSDQPSLYHGLFDAAGLVGGVLEAVARLGARTSPLPRALLGAARPLRAFIGQVEPTFDWTMTFPPTRQQITSSLTTAVYEQLCGGRPAGLSLDGIYRPIAPLLLNLQAAAGGFATAADTTARRRQVDLALYSKVTAYDRASTVLLGDPTVAVPLP